ncbi:MAG: GerMN domain-containing protein, partial [Spirochaetaceae bacterium]|nr:GerMN domain-containing protein [Spirochaetaceae bacterium]
SVGAFVLVFLIALVFFLFDGRTRINGVIFFPEPAQTGLSGEPRRIYRQETLEGNVRLLVREMLLGPMDIRHMNIFPPNTRLKSVFVRGAAVYLDFSPEILFLDTHTRLSFDELLAAVRQTVLFNFRQLADVIITINGQEPGYPSFFPGERQNL